MVQIIDVSTVFNDDRIPLIDVRSPAEYAHAHIPGAVNIPIFNDEERAQVGTRYHDAGKDAGFLLGLELTGPKLAPYVKKLNSLVPAHAPVIVYCWRGGMRSNAMAWLFDQAGHPASVIEGGYKAYRSYIRAACTDGRDFKVIGGMTGSGKTEILHQLQASGEQIVDLEALANHRGSVFGHLGQKEQPNNETFEILLWETLRKLDKSKPVYIEDESRSVGRVSLPESFFNYLQQSDFIMLDVKTEVRIERLVREYGIFGREALTENVLRLGKYIGGEAMNKAVEAIRENKLEIASGILLRYYDAKYVKSIERFPYRRRTVVTTETLDAKENARQIMQLIHKRNHTMHTTAGQ